MSFTPKTVLEFLTSIAAKHPNRVAVAGRGGELRYGELISRASRFGEELRARGVSANDRVVIIHSPSPEAVVAIVGVLAIGAVYVPVDPSQPKSRIAAVVADCEAAAIATDSPGNLEELEIGAVVISTGATRSDLKSTEWNVKAEGPAYIIYTSGSTGEPKGVLVGHKQLVFSTSARHEVYPDAGSFLMASSLAFDSAIAGLWGTLTIGGTLVLATEEERRDPVALVSLMGDYNVQSTLLIPSLYHELLAVASDSLLGLKFVITAGEPLTESLISKHFSALPLTELFNEYGPAEATVWSTYRRYTETAPARIGIPFPGVHLQVLDTEGVPVPDGKDGELYIGGRGVAIGYYGRPDDTASVFVDDPTGVIGGRWYRTGDQVRWSSDGLLEFRGRLDRQVKVRGRRIQLEAVEHALEQLPGILRAAVTTNDEQNAICAHVSLEPSNSLERVQWAIKELPSELRPDQFQEHDELPRGFTGKIDLQSLSGANSSTTTRTRSTTALTDSTVVPLRERVLSAWEEVLDSNRVPVDTNFFDLGGNSILAMRLQSALRRHVGAHMSLVSIFRYTTVNAQAEFLAAVDSDSDDGFANTANDRNTRRKQSAHSRRLRVNGGQR